MGGLWLKTGSFPKSIGLGSVEKTENSSINLNHPVHNMLLITSLHLLCCSTQATFVDEYQTTQTAQRLSV